MQEDQCHLLVWTRLYSVGEAKAEPGAVCQQQTLIARWAPTPFLIITGFQTSSHWHQSCSTQPLGPGGAGRAGGISRWVGLQQAAVLLQAEHRRELMLGATTPPSALVPTAILTG